MNFLFDLLSTQEYNNVKYHGGGEYGKQVLLDLLDKAPLGSEGFRFFILYNGNVFIEEEIKTRIEGDEYVHCIRAENYNGLASIIEANGIDRYYSPVPYYLPDHPDINRIKSSVTLLGTMHGLRKLEFPFDENEKFFRNDFITKVKHPLKRALFGTYIQKETAKIRRLLEIFDYNVIAVSRHTKYALLSLFPEMEPQKITYAQVIPDTIIRAAEEFQSPEEAPALLNNLGVSEKKYFLLISANRQEKNAIRVLEALRDYQVRLNGHKLVLLGVDADLGKKITSTFPRALDSVVLKDYVSRKELELLYRNAFAFVYPSLSEGYGYPPIEAMKYGIPVIASASTAITEVCGEGALYFNPLIPLEIANRLNQMMHEPGLAEEYGNRGKKRFAEILSEHEKASDIIYDYLFA